MAGHQEHIQPVKVCCTNIKVFFWGGSYNLTFWSACMVFAARLHLSDSFKLLSNNC